MSKKRLFAATLLLVGLVAVLLVLLAPRAMRLKTVQRRIAAELSRTSGNEIDFSRLELAWFPSPHFTFRNTRITARGHEITIPEIRITPGLAFLLGRSSHLRSLELIRPMIKLSSPLPAINKRPAGIIPATEIIIRKGTIIIPPLAAWTTTAVILKDIDLELRDRRKSVSLRLNGGSNISGKMRLNLFYNKEKRGYRGNYRIESLNPAFLRPRGINDIRILANPLSLNGDISGNRAGFNLSVNGSFPCFRYTPKPGKTAVINCGDARINITKNNKQLKVEIDHLKIPRPGLTLSGVIAITTPAAAPPQWNIDLRGADINLTAVRDDLLRLWPDNHVVKTVAGVVLGGRARKGSFAFKGPASRLSHLRDMRITADADGADIHPPHTNLYLTNASGPISIIDGYLKGSGLSASLGSSSGKNADLYLDLLKRDHAFILDLDLDVDLAGLPPVLGGLVKNKIFLRELERFKQVSGHGMAHLHLGDTLQRIRAGIMIHDAHGSAVYNRLPWPISISDGTLNIKPESVEWAGINGRAGPHRLADSGGSVTWTPGGAMKFEILPARGEIDSADFLATMRGHGFLPKVFGKVIKSISGPLEIRDFTLKGDPRKPAGWQYAMKISATGVRWRSKLIPGAFLTEKGRARITNRILKITDSKTWSLEQPIAVNADLRHHNFKNITGRLRIDGRIRKKLSSWVMAKGWLPTQLTPRTPVTLQGLTIMLAGDRTKVTGKIKAGPAAGGGTTVDINLSRSAHELTLNRLSIRGHGKRGTLKLHRTDTSGRTIDKLDWQGDLAGASITALLADPGFSLKDLSGDCRVVLVDDAPPQIKGHLRLKGLTSTKDAVGEIRITDLDMNDAPGGGTEINKLVIARNGQTITIKGLLFPQKKPPGYDISAQSPRLDWGNLMEMRKGLKYGDSGKADGRINFDIGSLDNITGLISGDGISMAPATGEIRFDHGDWQTLKFKKSRLCGLELEGILHPDTSGLDSSFNLFSNKDDLPDFEAVLPCLGFNNDLIRGRVNVDASLRGKKSSWTHGRLNLYSKKGFIRRLSLLSKALSLLNITGLVSGSFIRDLNLKGFTYSELDFKSHVDKGRLIIDRAIIRGSGLNIFAQGWVDIKNRDCEIVMLLAPLKTLDTIIGNLPIIGPAVGGRDTALIALPVKISGKIDDPVVATMPAKEVGAGIAAFITKTIKLPFAIFSPLIEAGEKAGK